MAKRNRWEARQVELTMFGSKFKQQTVIKYEEKKLDLTDTAKVACKPENLPALVRALADEIERNGFKTGAWDEKVKTPAQVLWTEMCNTAAAIDEDLGLFVRGLTNMGGKPVRSMFGTAPAYVGDREYVRRLRVLASRLDQMNLSPAKEEKTYLS